MGSVSNWKQKTIDENTVSKIETLNECLYERLLDYKAALPNKDMSLAYGASGILLYLCELQKVMKIDTNKLIYEYLLYIRDDLFEQIKNAGLYTGLAGFNYAVLSINEVTGDYSNLLNQLDEQLIEYYDKRWGSDISKLPLKYNITSNAEYDCIAGLSGTMRYVLRRAKESEKMLQLLYQQLDVICLLCQDKYIDSKLVKGWLYNKDYKSTEWNMEQYCYDLGLAHGIPGVLSILALLKINGIETAKSNSTLNNILEWLLEINSKYVKKSSWPFYIMPFSENDGLQNEYFARSIVVQLSRQISKLFIMNRHMWISCRLHGRTV